MTRWLVRLLRLTRYEWRKSKDGRLNGVGSKEIKRPNHASTETPAAISLGGCPCSGHFGARLSFLG